MSEYSGVDRRSKAHWTLNKEVQIPVLLTLILNIGIGIWYTSKLDSRIVTVELDQAQIKSNIKDITKDNTNTDKRVTVIETQLHSIIEGINDLKELIRDNYDRPKSRGKSSQ